MAMAGLAARLRRHRHVVAAAVLACTVTAATAVTVAGDPMPHMWHSFNTPDNGFLGAALYNGPTWRNADPRALYVEWGGFVPDRRGSWTFSTPTVGRSGFLTSVLTETSGTGLLTGTGNIYGLAFGQVPGPPLIFTLMLTVAPPSASEAQSTRTIVMRSGTKGTLPETGVLLNGVPAQAAAVTFRLDGTIDMPTGPNGEMEPATASDAEWLWWWDKVPVAATYRFDFRSQIGHMSLDNLVVYASPPTEVVPPTPVPVPTQRRAAAGTIALASQLAEIAASQTTLNQRRGGIATR